MAVSSRFPRRWFYTRDNTRISVMLKDPLLQPVLITMADLSPVDSLGRCGVNQSGTFTNVADQRQSLQHVYRGISTNNSASISNGSRAMDYAITGWNADGSFDGVDTTAFSVLGILDAYFQIWMALVQDGRNAAAFSQYSTQFKTSMDWFLNDSPALFPAEWAAIGVTTNGVSSLAMTLRLAAILLKEPSYVATSNTYVTQIGAQQNAAGWFNENGGFDSHYQGINMWRQAVLLNHVDQSHPMDKIAKLGFTWWKSRMIYPPSSPAGKIDGTGNSRTPVLNFGHYIENIIAMAFWARISRDRGLHDQAYRTYRYALTL